MDALIIRLMDSSRCFIVEKELAKCRWFIIINLPGKTNKLEGKKEWGKLWQKEPFGYRVHFSVRLHLFGWILIDPAIDFDWPIYRFFVRRKRKFFLGWSFFFTNQKTDQPASQPASKLDDQHHPHQYFYLNIIYFFNLILWSSS